MAKSKETFNKKEREKKRQKQKDEKLERKQERKASGVTKSFDDMLAYVDEFGNLSSVMPTAKKEVEMDIEHLYTGIPVREPEEIEKQGIVDFFNEAKGFGFIRDQKTNERIFVHQSEVQEQLFENDKVSFQTARGARGLSAVQVKRIV